LGILVGLFPLLEFQRLSDMACPSGTATLSIHFASNPTHNVDYIYGISHVSSFPEFHQIPFLEIGLFGVRVWHGGNTPILLYEQSVRLLNITAATSCALLQFPFRLARKGAAASRPARANLESRGRRPLARVWAGVKPSAGAWGRR
jgi:hypothetical protein